MEDVLLSQIKALTAQIEQMKAPPASGNVAEREVRFSFFMHEGATCGRRGSSLCEQWVTVCRRTAAESGVVDRDEFLPRTANANDRDERTHSRSGII